MNTTAQNKTTCDHCGKPFKNDRNDEYGKGLETRCDTCGKKLVECGDCFDSSDDCPECEEKYTRCPACFGSVEAGRCLDCKRTWCVADVDGDPCGKPAVGETDDGYGHGSFPYCEEHSPAK